MNVIKEKSDGKMIVKIEGVLDIKTAPELSAALKGELDDVTEVVFDLLKTEYTSSAGLRVLLKTFQILEPKGGTMKMINVNETFYDILKLAGFTDFIDIQKA